MHACRLEEVEKEALPQDPIREGKHHNMDYYTRFKNNLGTERRQRLLHELFQMIFSELRTSE